MHLTDAQRPVLDPVIPKAAQKARRTRSSVARIPRCSQWNPLDSADRRTVARSSRTVAVVPDVSSTLSSSGAPRRLEADPRKLAKRTSRSRRPGFTRKLRRRHVCVGEKGGLLRRETKARRGNQDHGTYRRLLSSSRRIIASALPHDVNAARALAQGAVSPATTEGDHRRPGCGSDPLDARLRKRRTELIAPHCSNRKGPATRTGARAPI
jgi:hypothetical protein